MVSKSREDYKNVFKNTFNDLSNDMNQADIASAVGVTRQTISDWRHGKTVPSADALGKLAEYFKVSSDYLLGRTENKSDSIDFSHACDLLGISKTFGERISLARITINNTPDEESLNKDILNSFGEEMFIEVFFEVWAAIKEKMIIATQKKIALALLINNNVYAPKKAKMRIVVGRMINRQLTAMQGITDENILRNKCEDAVNDFFKTKYKETNEPYLKYRAGDAFSRTFDIVCQECIKDEYIDASAVTVLKNWGMDDFIGYIKGKQYSIDGFMKRQLIANKEK